ncbi:hypothetical protein POF51_26480 [Brevibacillus sp. AG]|nr:hypothetical protein [Brevibacillus sp. AG]MDC0764271.1 hypothetical protein [Brevibacillus sp. AG]
MTMPIKNVMTVVYLSAHTIIIGVKQKLVEGVMITFLFAVAQIN